MNELYLRSLWKSSILIFTLTVFFVSFLLFKPVSLPYFTFVDNVIQGLLESVGLLLTLPFFLYGFGRTRIRSIFFAARVSQASIGQRWVPLLLSLALLCCVIGQFIWTFNENIAHLAVLFPSWADVGYLGFYFFVFLATLLFPAQPLPASTRMRIALDSLMLLVVVTTFWWFMILGPTILHEVGTVIDIVGIIVYPLATLILMFCLLLLVIRSYDHTFRPVVLILGLAFIILVFTNSIYSFQQLHNAYLTGSILDVGWPLGYMLVGLSARALLLMLASRRSPVHSQPDAYGGETVPPVPTSFL
jgi:hypothetical protein